MESATIMNPFVKLLTTPVTKPPKHGKPLLNLERALLWSFVLFVVGLMTGVWPLSSVAAVLCVVLSLLGAAQSLSQPFVVAPMTPSMGWNAMLLDIHTQLTRALTGYGGPTLDAVRATTSEVWAMASQTRHTDALMLLTEMLSAIDLALSGDEARALALLPDLKARILALPE